MKTILRILYALSVCAAAALLAGCGGGSTSPSYQPPARAKALGLKAFLRRLPCTTRRARVSELSNTPATHSTSGCRYVRRDLHRR